MRLQLLYLLLVFAAACGDARCQSFSDQALALGWPSSGDSTRGLAWCDYDGDGDPDVYLQNQGGTSRLLRNDVTSFTDVTGPMQVSHASSGWSAAWGDFDRDGKPDLYTGNYVANNLFRNLHPQPFVDVASSSGAADLSFAQSVAWSDHDVDGDLDLLISMEFDPHRLLQNEGDGSFIDISVLSGVNDPQSHSYGLSFGDYDQDGDPDCFISTCSGTTVNRLFKNLFAETGTTTYVEIAAAAGVDYSPNTYGAEWVDLDDDGDLDLFVTGALGELNHLYRNDGVLPMANVALAAGVAGPAVAGHGCDFGDYDNDGRIDIYVQDKLGPNRLYRNLGNLQFVEIANAAGAATNSSDGRDCAFVDYDGDGDLDLHAARIGRDRLYRNSGNANSWLQVVPVGTVDNPSAHGVTVEIVIGGVSQYRLMGAGAGAFSQNLLPAHFGCGTASLVDLVVVHWMDGTSDALSAVTANQRITIIQSSGQASVTGVGSACGPAGGLAPIFTAGGLPTIGNALFSLFIANAPPATPYAVFASTDLGPPQPLGNGCSLHLDLAGLLLLQQAGANPFLSGLTGGGVLTTIPLPIPPAPALAGFHLPLQTVVLDPAGVAPPGTAIPFTLTRALSLRLGY